MKIKKIKNSLKSRPAAFIIMFAIIGVGLLLITKAASPNLSIEAEDETLSSPASVISDSSASNGKAIKFSDSVQNYVKPQIKGVLDRDGYNSDKSVSVQNITIPSEYQSSVNNFVLMLDWSQIQPNSASDLNTSFIDDAISEAKAKSMHIKLRILAGIHAPNWVKIKDGGPFDVYDIDNNTGEVFTGTSPKYWTSSVKSAYANLMNELAAKYDTEPTISSVVNSMCSTIFAEPFIKNLSEGNNLNTFYDAGLTDALDQQCHDDSINVHNSAWKHTRTETAVNPLSYKGTDSSGNQKELFNTSFSIAWINKCRQILDNRCILGNNGFNATTFSSNYRQVIGAMICAGNPPPYFQTRQYAVITGSGHTIADVLNYAIDVGAGMVELPTQYKTVGITPEALAPLDSALEANNVIACPADRLLPNNQ